MPPRTRPALALLAAPLLTLPLLSATEATAAARPSLVNTRITHVYGANGHASTVDGRIFIGNVREDHANEQTTWQARVFRPEALTYDSEGKPQFANTFSPGRSTFVRNGENALTFCFPNPAAPYTLSGGVAVYTPFVFDSRMYNGANVFRRRPIDVRVSQPFTAQADIASFTTGNLEPLTTVSGASIRGIEPSMTSDGRLFIYQGGPQNNGTIDYLMYSYNPTPCAASGWSDPRPLSMLFNDPNPGLKRYPLAWQPLKAATGEAFGTTTTASTLIRGAYAWVDHEGRNVLFTAVRYTDGARREAVSLIGADTHFTAYHIDGAINTDRSDLAHLFYSSPMWNLEQERHPAQNFPVGSSNEDHYLPATKTHDVFPLFGSNTQDYNEVDVGDLSSPFQVLFLPMNELITRGGEYDLTRTPDLSGRFFTGTLTDTARISPDNATTQPPSGSLWEPHGKGKALVLPGGGALTVNLTDTSGALPGVGGFVRGFSVQLAVRPDAAINQGCTGNPYRYLLQKPGGLDLIYESDHTVQASFVINGQRVRLGRSPALPRGVWTHLAYTWDGVTGAFHEYINGVSTERALPVAAGTLRLGTGTLSVGAGVALDTQTCPANGEGSFRGAIDEVRLFSNARSNRTVCMSSHGADCKEAAIQGDPTEGQFGMSQQHPDCDSQSALGSTACTVSMHRVCAQRGASHALDNSRNILETIQQLVGNRPPISLMGVPASADATTVNVACGPIQHQGLAVTFEELARKHDGCADDRAAQSTACSAASRRWCSDRGWTSGQFFELTTRPWVACFNSGLIQNVPREQLGPAATAGNLTSAAARLEFSAWCQQRGYGAGIVQELPSSTTAEVHCFHPAATVPWRFNP
ncbi:LamG-like jellyroll fold domain-containing protein [Myxococcus vastator]|uniref:LamG-like jellyroll fold domain-containing protein n=1 Tax=Myxococcus vastator TaxID=2709664 RepID=UPI0013D5B061|nr:LamG-like jellyroll fold domain-containing protein [Myxococcus vastator]